MNPKVLAAGAVGAPISLILAWVYGELGGTMPAEVAGAFGALIAMAVGYLKRDNAVA